ncbi:MAG: ribonuclease E activity regulator RraA [Gemmatimonadetes bacterium]|nr:ribonuclease E activity regulator RraA [Gemmatimonadota bacterium]
MIVTADLFDAHPDKLQVLEAQFRSFGKVRAFSGPAATVHTFENHHPVKAFVEEPGEGRVLVVDGEGSLRVGLMGDRLAESAMRNGWAGVVILGAIRDSNGINALQFGVKALGTTARRAAHPVPGERLVTVTVAGAIIQPRDWIYADEDAVLVSREPLSA